MIRLLIADTHRTLREHLLRLCESHNMTVVAEASSSVEILEHTARLTPDVVVISLTMPTRGAFGAVRELKRRHPSVPVIVLSLYHDDEYALQALDAGASGFLMLEHAQDQLEETVRMFVLGGSTSAHSEGTFASI
jgi:two-component system, NarL family, invasion response regulator UvrY